MAALEKERRVKKTTSPKVKEAKSKFGRVAIRRSEKLSGKAPGTMEGKLQSPTHLSWLEEIDLDSEIGGCW